MGSHIIDILRQGIWASLSGGWFYDPHQNIFSNTFHLYLWMSLLVAPLILHLTLDSSVLVWGLYCLAVGVVFAILKCVNFRLHHMYDTTEMTEVKDESDKKDTSDKDSKTIELGSSSHGREDIELRPIGRPLSVQPGSSGQDEENNNRGGVEHVLPRRRSDRSGEKRKSSGQAPLAELEADGMDPQPGCDQSEKKTERRDKASPEGVEGESDKSTPVNQNAANQITTKADVEVNHQVSDGEVEQGEILALKLREDTDSDLSPDAGYRIRKRRKAVRRTKSSLEPSTRPTLPLHDVGMKSSVRSSLPPHQRFSMQTVLEQGQSESGLIRPHSDQNIVKRVRRSRRPGEGCAVVDVEQNIAVRRPSPCSLTVESEEACILHRMDRSNILCHRSASVDETVIPSRSKARPKPSMESATSLEAEIMLKLIARKQLEESERTCDVDVCKNLEESEWTSGCEKTQDTEETSCDIDIVQTPSGDSDKPCDIVKVKEIFDDETKSDKSKHKSKVPSSPHLSRSTEVLSDGTGAKSDSKPPTNSASVDGLGDKKTRAQLHRR